MSLPLKIKPKVDLCLHFERKPGNCSITTIILTPTRIRDEGNGQYVIGWSCSHSDPCYSETCYYARLKRNPNVKGAYDFVSS